MSVAVFAVWLAPREEHAISDARGVVNAAFPRSASRSQAINILLLRSKDLCGVLFSPNDTPKVASARHYPFIFRSFPSTSGFSAKADSAPHLAGKRKIV